MTSLHHGFTKNWQVSNLVIIRRHHSLPDSPTTPTLEEGGKKGKQKTRKDMDIDMLRIRSLIQDIENNDEEKQKN